MASDCYCKYVDILKEELVPAMGCTEPIALAYGASVARDFLEGEEPLEVKALCSGNIIKNAMCVTVPNTGNLVGIEPAILAGLIGGQSKLKMQVISKLNDADREKICIALENRLCQVELMVSPIPLHFILTVKSSSHSVTVEVTYKHTHLERVEADGRTIDLSEGALVQKTPVDRHCLSVDQIYEFAQSVNLSDVRPMLDEQIKDNLAIAEEGLKGKFGVNIGKVILDSGEGLRTKVLAYTAAASEARMEGCALPVVTNSGSGNQGITSSVPIIVYCREKKIPEDVMYRALVLSNLLTVHQKTGIGALSAFCGAVCAATAAGAAITYLRGGDLDAIKRTVSNCYGGVAGTICDGAKATCGYKIYGALSSAFLASDMALAHKYYKGGTGIIRGDVESSIEVIGRLGREGMGETDKKILQFMLEDGAR